MLDVAFIGAVAAFFESRPTFHVLVNNAGINRPMPTWQVDEADYDAVLFLAGDASGFVTAAPATGMGSSSPEIPFQNLPTRLQAIKVIGPMPHHLDAFIPVSPAGVGASNIIGFDMSELALDGVGVPLPHFVQQCAGCRSESMGCHFFFPKTQASKRCVEGIVCYRAFRGADTGEEVFPVAGYRFQLGQHLQHLVGKRHFMGTPHFHLLCRDCPNAGFEIKFLPFGHSKLTWPGKHMWQEFERDSHGRLPIMGIDGP